jgi:hypothetical protein
MKTTNALHAWYWPQMVPVNISNKEISNANILPKYYFGSQVLSKKLCNCNVIVSVNFDQLTLLFSAAAASSINACSNIQIPRESDL